MADKKFSDYSNQATAEAAGIILYQNAAGTNSYNQTHTQLKAQIAGAFDFSTDGSGILPIANGGTNSNSALANDLVMISSAGAVVESAISTAELGLLSGISSVSTGTADNDKFVTQGYVDDKAAAQNEFIELTDTPAAYVSANAIYTTNGTPDAVIETAVILTEGANTFNVTKGTASLDIAAGAAVDIDANLTVSGVFTVGTTNGGTLDFTAASKTLNVEDDSTVNQDLTTDATVTFAGVNATTFDTNVTAAGVTLSGTTLQADGTDSDIDILVLPKGTGAISVSGTTDYENNVTDDDDIPNKKYVDDAVASSDTFLELTDTISAYNTDRILFESGSAVVDSDDFKWDDTNKLLTTQSLVRDASSESVDDDNEITIATGVAGFGFVQAGDNEEWAQFAFTAAGVVTLIQNTANVVNTDTDANLCIYDAGSGIAIKNRLGSTKTIRYEINYS